MKAYLNKGYNERIFDKKTFQGKLHYARYSWLQKEVDKLQLKHPAVIELGCFDGKAINFLNGPVTYAGYDINWEGGLTIAREIWKDHPQYRFYECANPAQFNPENKLYDISVCQETLEHVPPADMDGYIQRLAIATRQYCFITVPNEKGIFMLLKYLFKKITGKKDQSYSLKELFYATTGQLDKIEREEHKGFDYEMLIKKLAAYFEVVSVKGLPLKILPRPLSFTIAIVLKAK